MVKQCFTCKYCKDQREKQRGSHYMGDEVSVLLSRMRPKQDTPDSLLTCSRNGILETPLEIIIF